MKRKIKDYFRYFLYIVFRFIFLITPKFIMKKILQFLAFFAYKFNKKHKRIAKANLDLVYQNQIDEKRKEEIIYNSYKSLVFNMYEFMENQTISKEDMFKKANIINADIIKKAHDEKRKVIYITAHYGGWELTLPYIALMFGEIAVVNRKMDNPHIQKLYAQARSKNKITMLEKQVAAKGMIKAFKENKSVAVVIDQHIGSGVDVLFLGQKDMATDSTARLALKFDAIIIPIFTVCNDFRDYTINVGEAIDVKTLEFKTDDKIQELTQLQNDLITKQVFFKPDYWLWQHKRFKKYHNDIYRKEKSV
ncbi:lipid A biosynthesis acyltransferase [Arcobacter aquimarinus]|uniref:Lipid A biosynthesis lauroyl acyltransferase n=1 Tax=Arcobacter aquimarinus TaxID=1315211 RepID=A0AAE7B6E5_9BACT|nr:lipid A biosynthesis acyltransferase [Arcobacter aquimarinus]QKE26717.1 lipid A biosynthesis lauroyl acyltransferase [Arcobacter aquimarinus]RXI35532.1 lipid A biosynthesis acyltransferase [Arcobacter aquimarinus]